MIEASSLQRVAAAFSLFLMHHCGGAHVMSWFTSNMLNCNIYQARCFITCIAGTLKGLMAEKEEANAKQDDRRCRKKEKQLSSFVELQKKPLRYKKGSLKLMIPMPSQELRK
jgi:hypothetical protein